MQTLLVIDDDVLQVKAYSAYLSRKGYNVLTALNGKEALRIIEDEEHLDCVTIDLHLPDMSGVDIAQALRAKNIPHLIISGIVGTEVSMSKLVDAGIHEQDIFYKPISLEIINAIIQKKISTK